MKNILNSIFIILFVTLPNFGISDHPAKIERSFDDIIYNHQTGVYNIPIGRAVEIYTPDNSIVIRLLNPTQNGRVEVQLCVLRKRNDSLQVIEAFSGLLHTYVPANNRLKVYSVLGDIEFLDSNLIILPDGWIVREFEGKLPRIEIFGERNSGN